MGFTEATGGGPEPTRRLRHRAGPQLSTGCPLTHCSGHIWKEQPWSKLRSCEASTKAVPGQPSVGVPRSCSVIYRHSLG